MVVTVVAVVKLLTLVRVGTVVTTKNYQLTFCRKQEKKKTITLSYQKIESMTKLINTKCDKSYKTQNVTKII